MSLYDVPLRYWGPKVTSLTVLCLFGISARFCSVFLRYFDVASFLFVMPFQYMSAVLQFHFCSFLTTLFCFAWVVSQVALRGWDGGSRVCGLHRLHPGAVRVRAYVLLCPCDCVSTSSHAHTNRDVWRDYFFQVSLTLCVFHLLWPSHSCLFGCNRTVCGPQWA